MSNYELLRSCAFCLLMHMLTKDGITGGDCKTLMFVQISPNSADLGETLCSLNFASRVRGIESGPARKQADLSELFKYKQMVRSTRQVLSNLILCSFEMLQLRCQINRQKISSMTRRKQKNYRIICSLCS